MISSKSNVKVVGAALCLAAGAGLAIDRPAYEAELRADASERSSLLASTGNVQYTDGRFVLSDGTGNNTLGISVGAQARWLFNFRDEDVAGEDNEFTHGGQISRVRMAFDGTVGSPDISYFIQIGADPVETADSDTNGSYDSMNMGTVHALDAWVQFDLEGGVYVRAGLGKPAQGFEETAHWWEQQTMERSIANDLFATQRQTFIQLGGQQDTFDWAVFFSDGIRSGSADFFSSAEADISIGGRVNVNITGTPEDFVGQSSFPGSADGMRFGVGGQYQTGGDTGIDTADIDVYLLNADFEIRGDGYRAAAHGYLLSADPEGGDEGTHFGIALRGGMFFNDNVEGFVGYDGLFFDEDQIGGDEDTQHIVRGGINFFPVQQSHAVRVTGEVFYVLDNTEALGNAAGFLSDGGLLTGGLSRQNILGFGDEAEFGVGVQVAVRQ